MTSPPLAKQTDAKKSILIIPSRVVSRPNQNIQEGGEEVEIAAQISVPQEGGWGWVVVFNAFWCTFVLDGVSYTFGSLLSDMTEDLRQSMSLVALINSVAIALYFIAGPLASAFINRFGFRACAMTGSVICACSLFISYFIANYASLILFYGVLAGFGYCLINMSSSLIVGFYFEKLRATAIAIASTGSSVGVMVLSPLNSYLVSLAGWRATTLFHSGLLAIIFFLGMTFRPLLSLSVVKTTEDPTRTVTYLPTLSKSAIQTMSPGAKSEGIKATATERLFSAVSNSNFPTAAAVVEEGLVTTTAQPSTSTAPAVSRLTLTAHNAQGAVSRRQLKQVQSMISRTSINTKKNIELTVHLEEAPPKKRSCWARLCHWEEHVPQSRPLYRDDAFYDGKMEMLPVYQKSRMDTNAEHKTGLEYQLAVSRAVAAGDLKEKRGVFTTAARRVLATMMDPKLLRRFSFLLFGTSGFFMYLGFLVPYVFVKDRNLEAGISVQHATMFVTVLGFANALGKLSIGALAAKISPIKLYAASCICSGISTILSNLQYTAYYQYGFCCLFGFFSASLVCLRSMVLVSLYGLEKLTNATGMLLLFQGVGSLISTPIAGFLKNMFGYSVAFYVAGLFMVIGGCFIIPMEKIVARESKLATQKT